MKMPLLTLSRYVPSLILELHLLAMIVEHEPRIRLLGIFNHFIHTLTSLINVVFSFHTRKSCCHVAWLKGQEDHFGISFECLGDGLVLLIQGSLRHAVSQETTTLICWNTRRRSDYPP